MFDPSKIVFDASTIEMHTQRIVEILEYVEEGAKNYNNVKTEDILAVNEEAKFLSDGIERFVNSVTNQ